MAKLKFAILQKGQDRIGKTVLFCATCGYPDAGELAADAEACPSCGSTLDEMEAPNATAEQIAQQITDGLLNEGDRLNRPLAPADPGFQRPTKKYAGRIDGRRITRSAVQKRARLL